MEALRTIQYAEDITVELHQDDDNENPIQEFDGQAHLQVWHRHYDFGNTKEFSSPEAAEEFFQENDAIVLPVYLYDHSGLTVNTRGFSCPWDSGQVGYVWCTLDEADKLRGTRDPEKVLEFLRSTVELLDHYLTGNVYGYVVKRNGETLDSCWGFYGDPDESGIMDEAKGSAEYHVEKIAKERQAYLESRQGCLAI